MALLLVPKAVRNNLDIILRYRMDPTCVGVGGEGENPPQHGEGDHAQHGGGAPAK